ncbi:esterase family protein [Pedobacter lithocola]|uniref:Esterase family protein n=1 Tax=Pedobacter lithocola TaxID=1908239 RepID=A0ABV8PAL9_9SPHI
MHREYHKWFSNNLNRDMELLVFGYSGRAVLFFPTRTARFYDYENWGIVNSIHTALNNGEIQLICLDSIDGESFYNKDVFPSVRIERHLQYEKYILEEVIPFVNAINNSNFLETAGCSMGAYHAINLATKYPWLFKKAVGISGRYDLTEAPGDFEDLLNGFRSDKVYYNMPAQFIANIENEETLNQLRAMEIILAVGETDPFLEGNLQLSKLLNEKGINNHFYQWGSNAHRPHYWRQMVPIYI